MPHVPLGHRILIRMPYREKKLLPARATRSILFVTHHLVTRGYQILLRISVARRESYSSVIIVIVTSWTIAIDMHAMISLSTTSLHMAIRRKSWTRHRILILNLLILNCCPNVSCISLSHAWEHPDDCPSLSLCYSWWTTMYFIAGRERKKRKGLIWRFGCASFFRRDRAL